MVTGSKSVTNELVQDVLSGIVSVAALLSFSSGIAHRFPGFNTGECIGLQEKRMLRNPTSEAMSFDSVCGVISTVVNDRRDPTELTDSEIPTSALSCAESIDSDDGSMSLHPDKLAQAINLCLFGDLTELELSDLWTLRCAQVQVVPLAVENYSESRA